MCRSVKKINVQDREIAFDKLNQSFTICLIYLNALIAEEDDQSKFESSVR